MKDWIVSTSRCGGVRRSLDRQTDQALIPLDIQEDFGISELEGDVMLVSRDDDLHDKVRSLLHSEGYGCDIPERTSEAIGLLKLLKLSDDNCGLYSQIPMAAL